MFILRASFCSRRSPAQRGTIAGETSPGRTQERAPGRRMLKAGTETGREQQGDPCYTAGRCVGKREDCWGFTAGSTSSFCPAAVSVLYLTVVSCEIYGWSLELG